MKYQRAWVVGEWYRYLTIGRLVSDKVRCFETNESRLWAYSLCIVLRRNPWLNNKHRKFSRFRKAL